MKKINLLIFILTLVTFDIYCNKKVISLAPNITDIMYYLGYEKNIIAVDRFSKKPRNSIIIGDLMTINYEKLISLNPDIIFLTKEQENIAKKIRKIKKIKVHIVDIKNLNKLNFEINKVSKLLNLKSKETPIAPVLSISKIINKKLKALIIIDRNHKNLNNIFVAGNNNFINDYLPVLNLQNVIKKSNYPKLNIENIISLNPDVIIDLTHGADIKAWSKYRQINAVKNNKVYKASTKLTIPSPEIINNIIEIKSKLWN